MCRERGQPRSWKSIGLFKVSLKHIATHCNTLQHMCGETGQPRSWKQCVVMCCSVAVCYNVLQCNAVWCSVLQRGAVCKMSSVVILMVKLQCVAVCCSVLQCVAVCCSVLCKMSSVVILMVKLMTFRSRTPRRQVKGLSEARERSIEFVTFCWSSLWHFDGQVDDISIPPKDGDFALQTPRTEFGGMVRMATHCNTHCNTHCAIALSLVMSHTLQHTLQHTILEVWFGYSTDDLPKMNLLTLLVA